MSDSSPTEKIIIQTVEGPFEIFGVRVGPLVVHNTTGAKLLGRWTISHAHSGTAVRRDLCCQYSALALAKALKHLDWDFTVTIVAGKVKLGHHNAADLAKGSIICSSWPERCGRCAPRPRAIHGGPPK